MLLQLYYTIKFKSSTHLCSYLCVYCVNYFVSHPFFSSFGVSCCSGKHAQSLSRCWGMFLYSCSVLQLYAFAQSYFVCIYSLCTSGSLCIKSLQIMQRYECIQKCMHVQIGWCSHAYMTVCVDEQDCGCRCLEDAHIQYVHYIYCYYFFGPWVIMQNSFGDGGENGFIYRTM